MESKNTNSIGAPQEKFFDAKIDHFNGGNQTTYPMRYIIDDKYYNPESGPILFYCGNEGGVWAFYNNSGFMVETLAKELGALVLFGEHRFYGQSMPFGDDTFKKENLKFLSVKQVMMDYVDLLKSVKSERPELKDRAVISFGGSYGGMLAGWMRIKYPMHIQGAISSSAPLLWFRGKTDPSAFTQIAGNVMTKQGHRECYDD
jgi:hypothetical protein